VEEILAPELYMYPNPATRILTLELRNLGEVCSTVKVFNIAGRAVYNAEHTQSMVEIDVSGLDEGVYFVAVKVNEYVATKKLQILK
jgi:hypothetical protein